MTDFKELQARAEQINIANGWTRGRDLKEAIDHGDVSGVTEATEHQIAVLALIMTEASEAIEEIRNGHAPTETYYAPDSPGQAATMFQRKPEGVPSELADVVIRAMSFAEVWGIDLEAAIVEKMAYNETRAYRHGGKRL